MNKVTENPTPAQGPVLTIEEQGPDRVIYRGEDAIATVWAPYGDLAEDIIKALAANCHDELVAALRDTSRDSLAGRCWCPRRKPNVGHTEACERARALLAKVGAVSRVEAPHA